MRILISGKNLEVSAYLRETVEKKMGKLERFFPSDAEAHVTLSVEKNRHIVEITIPHQGRFIRSEEISGDMYASIDAALDKLERQIRKHKSNLKKGLREDAFAAHYPEEPAAEDHTPRVVRVKRFQIKPMSEEEAILQMALVGHSFYVFENAETGKINVLYSRKDGNLGLIEPD
ncbi:MAG: ribosome-associated translation inhibitor RaiA [Clostridiales bacterium]|nr:ribosome-associated translation inhibitor RaiA [Clostridiales bacterium]